MLSDQVFQKECIMARKVYNECVIVDCPTYRVPIPPGFPPPINVIDCEVTNIVPEGEVVANGEVSATVNFVLNIEYDAGQGQSQFIQQSAQYRRRRISLEGALPGMEVVILPLIRCLSCTPELNGNGPAIVCEVGVYIVVKVVAEVQLEIKEARFCPEPPECEQVEPIGCEEWFEMAEAGEFWPPFPPQPPRDRSV